MSTPKLPAFIDRKRGGIWIYDEGHGVNVIVPSWRTLDLDSVEAIAAEIRVMGRVMRDVRVATPAEQARIVRLAQDGVALTPAARHALAPVVRAAPWERPRAWLRVAWRQLLADLRRSLHNLPGVRTLGTRD